METRKQLIQEIMAGINAFKHKMSRYAGSGVTRHGKAVIPHSQWFVLCIIEANKNLGIKEISNMLSITSSATTQLVDGLVKSGYVIRKTNAEDKRSLQLMLSKKGQTQMKKMKANYMKVMQKMFKALTDKELTTYNNLHKKILTHLHHE